MTKQSTNIEQLSDIERFALAAIVSHPTLPELLPADVSRTAVARLITLGLVWRKSGVLHPSEQGTNIAKAPHEPLPVRKDHLKLV